MQPSATYEPGSYIVWFDSQYETAEAAAEALNGTSLPPLQPGQSPEDLVRQRLRTLGYAENLLSVLEPVAEYVANENRHGSGMLSAGRTSPGNCRTKRRRKCSSV